MSKIIIYSSVIRAIERLYVKMSLHVLHKQVHNYDKKSPKSIHEYAADLESPLLECIDEIINNEEPEDPHTIDYSLITSITTTPSAHPRYHVQGHPHLVNKKNMGELSKYFKARNNGSDLHPDIGERLEHSIWEHLYAAIRHARQHENNHAKMHVDIACGACKELCHYLPEEQYRGFVCEIEKHLDTLKSENQLLNI